MGGAHATSANSTCLLEFAEVASATCSFGATSPRGQNNEHNSEMHVCTPHVYVPRLQISRVSSAVRLYVVLISTVKHPTHMRDRSRTEAERCCRSDGLNHQTVHLDKMHFCSPRKGGFGQPAPKSFPECPNGPPNLALVWIGPVMPRRHYVGYYARLSLNQRGVTPAIHT